LEHKLIEEISDLHASVCKALGDPRRILLLYALTEKGRNVSQLAGLLEAPQPVVSRHLQTLHAQGMVKREREGAEIFYSLADTRVIQALDLLRAFLADRLAAQAQLVEAI
jgi:ArsR family transcriptional regulator